MRLGAELRQLRRREALTLEQVCDRLGWASTSKLSRIELGQSRPDLADVLDLLDIYQVPAPARDALIVIARDAATSRGWWKTLGEMSERQRTYAELEAGAAHIVEYQPAVVPGLLQTPEYARFRVSARRPVHAGDRRGRRGACPGSAAGGCCVAPTQRATRWCSPRRPATRAICRSRSGVSNCGTWSP
ncbi:helix-turn-helix domain-containing protein [Micromonospora sp. NBC_00389]